MRLGRVLAVLTVAAAAVGGTVVPASATTPGADGAVAFRFDKQLWLVSKISDPTPIPGTVDGHDPDWSPDGESLAYIQGGQVRILAVASGDTDSVPGLSDAGSVDWSPDGDTLMVERSVRGALPSIWTVELSGQDLTRVARPGRCSQFGFLQPRWGPDGDRFLYHNTTRSSAECRQLSPGATIRSFTSNERISVQRLLAGDPFTANVGVYRVDFTAEGQSVVGYGSEDSGSADFKVNFTNGAVVWHSFAGCVDGDPCLQETVPTPSGGAASLGGNSWHDGPIRWCLGVSGWSQCWYDPDIWVEGDETGFSWQGASQIDVQPIPAS